MNNIFLNIVRTIIGAFIGMIFAAGWVLYESILRNVILRGNMDTSWSALIINALLGFIIGGILIHKVNIKINLK